MFKQEIRNYCLWLYLTSWQSAFNKFEWKCPCTLFFGDTRWPSCLRHWATSRKVAGSIPDGVIGIFHWHNPSAALWLWGRLSLWHKWVPDILLGGKGGRCIGLTTLPPSCADCHEIWEPQPPGTLRACPDLYRNCFTFYSLLQNVPTRSGAHPASYSTSAVFSFFRIKLPKCKPDLLPPSIAEVNNAWNSTSTPCIRLSSMIIKHGYKPLYLPC